MQNRLYNKNKNITSKIMTIEELKQNFEMLEDGEDKFAYLIELGKTLSPFPEVLKNDEHRIYGCSSNVWFDYKKNGDKYEFVFESDALIVKGLLYVVGVIFNSKTIKEISDIDAIKIFDDIGLSGTLSNQRQVGLLSVIKKIKEIK